MANKKQVTVEILGDAKQYEQTVRRSAKITEEFAKELEKLDKLRLDAKALTVKADIADAERQLKKLGDESSEMFKRRASQIGDSLTAFGKNATVGLTLPILAGFKAASSAASDLGEAVNFTNKLFTSSAGEIHKFGAEAKNSYGLSKTAVEQYAQSFAGLLRTGVSSQQELADKSIELTKRASDLGSALNKSSADVAAALRSGLAGETEPLRALNIVINEASVKTRAYALGLAKTGAEVSDQAKIQARYSLIMEQSTFAAGNFADTLGTSLPNQAKRAEAGMESATATFGQKVQPAMMAAYEAVGTLAEKFGNLSGTQQQVVLFGATAAAALGPIVGTAGNVVKGVGQMKSAIDGMRNSEGSLTGMGKAMTGLGVAGAAGVAVAGAFALKDALYAIDTQKVTKEFTDLQAAIAGYGNQSVKTAAAQYAATIQMSKGISDTVKLNPWSNASEKLKDAERAFADIQKLIKVDPANARVMIETLEALPDPGERARKKIADLRAELEKNEAISKTAAATNDTLGVSFEKFAIAVYGATQSVRKGVENAQTAMKDWKSAAQLAADAQVAAIKTQIDANRSAEQGESVRRAIADAERGRVEQTITAARNVEAATKTLNDARAKQLDLARNVKDAEKDLASSQLDLYNATQNQRIAEQRLNDVYNDLPPKIEDVKKAEDDLEAARQSRKSAEKQARNATEAYTNAQEDLADLQANGASDAEAALARARRNAESAVRGVARAEKELVDLLNRGGATQEEVADGQDRIADAKDRVKESTDRVADAEKKLAGISKEITDAEAAVAEKRDDLDQANKDVEKSTQKVNDAEKKLMDEREGRKPSQADIQKAVDDLQASMQKVADKTDEVKRKEGELATARADQKQGFADIAAAESKLKDTTLANEAERKRAVENVTGAYKAQADFLLSEKYNKAVANASVIANGIGSSSTSSGTSTGMVGSSSTVAPNLKSGGSRSWRNNNPGNINYGDFAKSHGAIGVESGPNGRFAVFATEQDGWDALAALLHGSAYNNLSIGAAFQKYAPAGDNNDPVAYAAAVARKVGVSVSTKVRDLTPAQFQKLMGAIRDVEGWKVGTVKASSGASSTAGKIYGPPAPAGTKVVKKGGGTSAGAGSGASFFAGGGEITVETADPEDIADEIDNKTGRRISLWSTSNLKALNNLGDDFAGNFEDLTSAFSGNFEDLTSAFSEYFDGQEVTMPPAFDDAVSRFVGAVEIFANFANKGSYAGNISGPGVVIPSAASILGDNPTATASMRIAAAAALAGQSANPPAPTPATPIQLTTTSGTPISVDPLTGERRPVTTDGVTINLGGVTIASSSSGRVNVLDGLRKAAYEAGLIDSEGYLKLRN